MVLQPCVNKIYEPLTTTPLDQMIIFGSKLQWDLKSILSIGQPSHIHRPDAKILQHYLG